MTRGGGSNNNNNMKKSYATTSGVVPEYLDKSARSTKRNFTATRRVSLELARSLLLLSPPFRVILLFIHHNKLFRFENKNRIVYPTIVNKCLSTSTVRLFVCLFFFCLLLLLLFFIYFIFYFFLSPYSFILITRIFIQQTSLS